MCDEGPAGINEIFILVPHDDDAIHVSLDAFVLKIAENNCVGAVEWNPARDFDSALGLFDGGRSKPSPTPDTGMYPRLAGRECHSVIAREPEYITC